MMRVVLVHPAGYNWVPGKKDVAATANRMAPLGLLSIAAFLEKRGHDVHLIDCLGPGATTGTESVVRQIIGHAPDLVGFSTTTSGFLNAYDMASCLKKRHPKLPVVFGGVHVSALRATLMDQFEHIDYLCVGEGELTMADLADGKHLGDIPGLVWRRNGSPVANPPREYIRDLDSLPFPAYKKLKGFPGGYNLPLFSYIHTPGATMVTSRGCPYQCSYCDRSVFQHKYRYNSAEYVYEHMAYLRAEFGVRHLNIYDDLFTLNRKRIVRLCRLLTTKPLGIQFNCAVRVGHVDDELLALLKSAGALMVSLGIETGDTDLMAAHKPGLRLEAVRDTVKRIQAAGLRAKGLFMMGLPGETAASIQKTSDFAVSLGLDDMNMSKFTPFHGAPVWQTVLTEGCFEEEWRKMNCLNFVYVPKDIDSRETLDQLYNRHVKRFYSDPRWRRKVRQRLWQHRHSFWYFIKHLPDFLSAMRTFEPKTNKGE